ncbi:MAG: GNAT family N-acetyltransferase [Ectothiorhodospira sp.]
MSRIRSRHRQEPHPSSRGGAARRSGPLPGSPPVRAAGRERLIRPLRDGDAPHIPDLAATSRELEWIFPGLPYPLRPPWLAGALAACPETTVCAEGGRVVGLAALRDPHPGGEAFIEHLAVHPERRCRGLGTHLLRSLLLRAFQYYRCHEVHARVSSDNMPATLFFYEAGFLPYGIDGVDGRGTVLRLRLGRRDLDEG